MGNCASLWTQTLGKGQVPGPYPSWCWLSVVRGRTPFGLTSVPVSWLYLWQVHPLAFGGTGRECCLFLFAAGPILACSVAPPFSSPHPHHTHSLAYFSPAPWLPCFFGWGLGPGLPTSLSSVLHIPNVLQPLPRSPQSSAPPPPRPRTGCEFRSGVAWAARACACFLQGREDGGKGERKGQQLCWVILWVWPSKCD